MKTMKKLLVSLLIVAMLASLFSVGAMAAMTDTGTVSINGARAGVTYKFYRILDLASTNGVNQHQYVTNSTWEGFLTGRTDVKVTDGNVVAETSFDPAVFALDALTYAKNNTISADASVDVTVSGATTAVPNLQYGYYVVATYDDGDETPEKASAATLYKSTLSINEKNTGLPMIEKKVNGLKSDSAGIGNIIKYEVIITAAAGTDTYSIADTLPAGVDYYTDATHAATIAYAGGAATEVTPAVAGGVISITLDATERAKLANYDKAVFTYYAKINENASTDAAGNVNTAKLTYGTGSTKSASATVYTSYLTLDKYISGGTTHLAGAEFVLKFGVQYATLSGSGDEYKVTGWVGSIEDATKITTGDAQIKISLLDNGQYVLVETKAPAGYRGSADTSVDVTDVKDTDGNVTSVTPGAAEVYNTPGTELPSTGGMGTTMFYVLGAILVIGGSAVLIARKRREEN